MSIIRTRVAKSLDSYFLAVVVKGGWRRDPNMAVSSKNMLQWAFWSGRAGGWHHEVGADRCIVAAQHLGQNGCCHTINNFRIGLKPLKLKASATYPISHTINNFRIGLKLTSFGDCRKMRVTRSTISASD